jgi:hypothetical protein
MKYGPRDGAHTEPIRQAITRLHGRFTVAQLLEDLREHATPEQLQAWTYSGNLGHQILKWREDGQLRLASIAEVGGRVYEVTDEWEPT